MSNALEIIGSVVTAIGEVAVENNKKEALKSQFSVAFEALKEKYKYCRNNSSRVSYDLYTKAITYYGMMEVEGDTILNMIPYRTYEDSSKRAAAFFKKYDINPNADVHIHIHVHQNNSYNKSQPINHYENIFDMFFKK